MTMPGDKPLTVIGRTNENRRASKPLMEKRRRARINHSLAELKTLILDAVKKEQQSTRHSKLEKADILEMTVKHLQNMHRQQSMVQSGSNKFQAGFKECTKEVTHFVGKTEEMDPEVRSRLLNHLSRCLVNYQNVPETDNQSNSNGVAPSPCSSYSADGQYYDRPDSAGPDYATYCSSPTRPASTSSSYKFQPSPASAERGSRSSTPGYYVPVAPTVQARLENNDQCEYNSFASVRMDTVPLENYTERPTSPLNLVVGAGKEYKYYNASPASSSTGTNEEVPMKDTEYPDNEIMEQRDRFYPVPEDDSVWRPW